jgi:hypothetical protein
MPFFCVSLPVALGRVLYYIIYRIDFLLVDSSGSLMTGVHSDMAWKPCTGPRCMVEDLLIRTVFSLYT